ANFHWSVRVIGFPGQRTAGRAGKATPYGPACMTQNECGSLRARPTGVNEMRRASFGRRGREGGGPAARTGDRPEGDLRRGLLGPRAGTGAGWRPAPVGLRWCSVGRGEEGCGGFGQDPGWGGSDTTQVSFHPLPPPPRASPHGDTAPVATAAVCTASTDRRRRCREGSVV